MSTRVLSSAFATQPILQVRRDSDDDEAQVLGDPADSNRFITLNSPIVGSSQTFGDWVGKENELFPSLAQTADSFVQGNVFGVSAHPTKTTGIADPFGGSNAISVEWPDTVDRRFGTETGGSNGLVPAYTGDVTFSFWARVASGTLTLRSSLRSSITADVANRDHIVTTTWQRFEHTNARTEANGLTGFYFSRNTIATVEIYGLQMERSSSAGEFQVTTTGPSGYAYVSEARDQSGNGRHAVQTTTTAQPRIVNAGVLEVDEKNNPTIRLNRLNSQRLLCSVPVIDATSSHFISLVAQMEGSGPTERLIAQGEGSLSGRFFFSTRITRANSYRYFINAATNVAIDSGLAPTNGELDYLSLERMTNDFTLYVNGNQGGTQTQSGVSVNQSVFAIGSDSVGGDTYNGTLGQVVVWNSDQSANRNAIATEATDAFGIVLA
jgi:hypothetical protein